MLCYLIKSNTIPIHNITTINFLGSFPSVAKSPDGKYPEFAFIGRSNVGKSSLINYICNRKKLAKTSSTPGKTQLINLFEVDYKWILADLPGYGYAKVSKKLRQRFSHMIAGYLNKRANLYCVFVLIDARIKPQAVDIDQIDWMGSNSVPFVIVFTKAEFGKNKNTQENIDAFLKIVEESWDPLPQYFVTSAIDKVGRDELLDFIGKYSNDE